MAVNNMVLNGWDMTFLISAEGYSVRYEKVQGPNAGTMINGTTNEDVRAIKAVVTVPLIPMTSEQHSALLSHLYSDEYSSLYYFDTRKENFRQAVMCYESQDAVCRGAAFGKNVYWEGQQLTFRDRFNWE